MKTAELLVRCLENEGVDTIFGIPGEENIAVVEALRDSTIRFVVTRHEQGAAFMADVSGRLTGKAGVCMATLGPGGTNLLTGVADAQLDRAPLVAITGQSALEVTHKESHQFIDLVEIFRPVTKWNTQVKLPAVMNESVRKAFKVAQTEKPGATHLDVPEDIADQETDEEPLPVNTPRMAEPAGADVRRALDLIGKARHPVIIAGNGVIRSRASRELIECAEAFGIPVTETFMGKGAVPDDHPLFIGTIGLQSGDVDASGIGGADLVVAVGYDMVEYAPHFWNPARDKTIINIDTRPAEVDSHFNVSVGLLGSIPTSLSLLAARAWDTARHVVPAMKHVVNEVLESGERDGGFPLKPQRIIACLRKALGPKDIVISDVGAHKLWVARLFPCFEPNTCIISNGLATMGIAVPGAVAAKLVYPDRKVVAVTGDGGFLMNSQELETAVRVGTSFVVLIFRDDAYGLIDWKQRRAYGHATSVNFGNPDFVKYAESFGAKGYRVRAAEELGPILTEALKQSVPSVIDCPVDYRENGRLTECLGRFVCSA